MKAFITFLLALFTTTTLKADTIYPSTIPEYVSTTVMILNAAQTGGGTGVVWHSSKNLSLILTNDHICEAVKHGGFVKKDNKMYKVAAFKMSNLHDVCLLSVHANLGIDTQIADKAPKMYSEATVAGYPLLAPETVVKGHFSKHQIITVVTGTRPCTNEEFQKNPMGCLFMGFPITHSYNAQYTSVTILPGNSGSPVFNDKGEIAGLVFASASRELAYAYIVPQEYVKYFVETEVDNLSWQVPTKAPVEKVQNNNLKSFNYNNLYYQPIYNIEE